MKTKLQKAAFFILTIILGGCVPSLHPLFTENELVFDSNLVGKWVVPDDANEYWQFTAAANKKYDVFYKDKKGIGKFDGRLGKLGNDTFIDLYPKDINIPGNDFYKAHLIGAHTFVRIEFVGNQLDLKAMNPDSLDKLLKTDPNAIKHERAEERTILTAPTPQLQAFVKKYSRDTNANIYGQVEKDKLLKKVKIDSNSVK